MRGMPGMRQTSLRTNGSSGRARWRRPTSRGRMAISLGASALFHGALLAWVTIGIPEGRRAAGGFERPGTDVEAEPKERIIEMVRIQPPGVLPSGGAGGASAGAAGRSAAPEAALPTELPPVSVRGTGAAAAGEVLLAAAPVSPVALPALGDLLAAEAPARNRGVLRKRPESGAFPARGGRWTTSTSGRGFGGGGVTIRGVGTDCITAGSGGAGTRTGVGIPGLGRGGAIGGAIIGGARGGGRRMGWSGR